MPVPQLGIYVYGGTRSTRNYTFHLDREQSGRSSKVSGSRLIREDKDSNKSGGQKKGKRPA